MLLIQQNPNSITFTCRVTPRASQCKIKGEKGGILLVSLNTPPIEGRANEALIELLAKLLRVPKKNIEIIHGLHNRNKVVSISGINSQSLRALVA